ncbi:hypothetical protein E4U48_001604 [Claviceps purpurea]|nr:hypothetical protein E4U48_001604 [Claviceps purpurea]
MPRFSVAFTKRKSASEGLDNVPLPSTDGPSFRVIDRAELANGRSFDGGARRNRASKSFSAKTNMVDLGAEDNMFADLKVNRASDISNTTKATSTDNSSRHSDASTAPSSADMNGREDARTPPKTAPQEMPSHSSTRSIGSGFLDRASRTFSFGGTKKQSTPPPIAPDPVPDMPPVLRFGGREHSGLPASRGRTASPLNNATPANDEERDEDLGGDFGSMFKGFEKRASTATLTLADHDNAAPRSLTGNRHGTPGPTSPLTHAPTEPLLSQDQSPTRGDSPSPPSTSPHDDLEPPPVPRHEHANSFEYSSRPDDILEDEDAKLLRESVTAMKFLSEEYDDAPNHDAHNTVRHGDGEYSEPAQTIASGFHREDNMFDGNASAIGRGPQRFIPRGTTPSGNKVMTPAQFEKYRQAKETGGTTSRDGRRSAMSPVPPNDDDDEDEINYDDDEDEQEKSKQQTRQRRKQEAHMAVYRQQMMKVTGETSSTTSLPSRQPLARPTLTQSSTAPALGHLATPTLDPAAANAIANASSEEDDEDVPLAILQAHGFPHKNRPPNRLSPSGSNPNLRASVVGLSAPRPTSMVGSDAPSNNGRRQQQNLPAFARNLPQDPFVGASVARPAIRESLHFGDAKRQPSPQPPQGQGLLPPGGLVGVIANEERSRALRRGSPSVDPSKMMGGMGHLGGQVGQDPFAAMAGHPMYNAAGGMSGMPMMQQPMLTPGDQAQIQMTQQMQQFMQMQMQMQTQFMQMMATGGAAMPQQQNGMQFPYGGGLPGAQSMGDLNRHSMMVGDPMLEQSRPMDHHPHQLHPHPHAHLHPNAPPNRNRTMSMVQPSSSSFLAPFTQGGIPSIRGVGVGAAGPGATGPGGAYSPSIAPSERSNVGLPGRYRPVSQAPGAPSALGQHVRSNTISGDLSNWSDDKSKSTVKMLRKEGGVSDEEDDDEEEGWEAMRRKREEKRSMWRGKKEADIGGEGLHVAF